jgi:hypothetical protein
MKIIRAYPPNFRAIVSIFSHARKQGVIFTFGDTIYNPSGGIIPDALRVHESVHSDRQGASPDAWWEQYLSSAAFRFDEELPAHRAEFAFLAAANIYRSQVEKHLRAVADRLSGPLYGCMVSFDKAKELISA